MNDVSGVGFNDHHGCVELTLFGTKRVFFRCRMLPDEATSFEHDGHENGHRACVCSACTLASRSLVLFLFFFGVRRTYLVFPHLRCRNGLDDFARRRRWIRQFRRLSPLIKKNEFVREEVTDREFHQLTSRLDDLHGAAVEPFLRPNDRCQDASPVRSGNAGQNGNTFRGTSPRPRGIKPAQHQASGSIRFGPFR